MSAGLGERRVRMVVPHRDEDVRRGQEKSGQYHRGAELRKAPGGGEDDVSIKPSPLLHVNTDWISYPDCKQIRIQRVRTVRRAGRDILFWTDLRSPRVAHNMNVPKPVGDQNSPGLPIASQIPLGTSRNTRT